MQCIYKTLISVSVLWGKHHFWNYTEIKHLGTKTSCCFFLTMLVSAAWITVLLFWHGWIICISITTRSEREQPACKLIIIIASRKIKLTYTHVYVVPEKSIFPAQRTSPPPGTWYFPLQILAFETPSPKEFPMTYLGVGMDILWNHIINVIVFFLWLIFFYVMCFSFSLEPRFCFLLISPMKSLRFVHGSFLMNKSILFL